jgi:hypothetical protein
MGTGLRRCETYEGSAVHETCPPARALSDEHWRHIPTNNPFERILREIKRWSKAGVVAVSGRRSALNPTAARLRHVAGRQTLTKRDPNMRLLDDTELPNATT